MRNFMIFKANGLGHPNSEKFTLFPLPNLTLVLNVINLS
jgi:hypothetical protein